MMAQSGGRIPAWKRLGLTLRNSSQSGEQQQLESVQVAEQNRKKLAGEPNDAGSSTVAAPTEQPGSRLGKRKHHSDPAEHGESPRKSRKSHQLEDGGGNHSVVAANEGDGLEKSAPGPQEFDNAPRPKGDPNYRKKKEKKTKEKRNRQTLSPERPDPSLNDSTLVVSTEIDFPTSPPVTSSATKPDSSPTPRTDRRKSVTFTPDTKTADGNSASNLFKKWVQEQKEPSAEFSQTEVAQFVPPPKAHPANSNGSAPKTKEDLPVTKGKKKDPSLYLSYLTQYHNDRSNWKFNKAKQNDILDNALNIFRIPQDHSEALIEYIKGLKGAGAIERLQKRCIATLEEVEKADAQDTSSMDDPKVRKAAQEEALQERLTQERKRRRVEGDIENMLDHPYTEGYIRRLKRERAEALLTTLNLAAPTPGTNGAQAMVRDSRKRKRRVEASSDESSDSDSSEISSSSEESSSSEDNDSESSSNSGVSTEGKSEASSETEIESGDDSGDSSEESD